MVTHDPYAAAIADRILFLADGLIVRDMPRAEAERRDRGDGRAHPDLMLAVALKGLAGRKVRALADGDRDHPRRRDDQRHLHPHGHDQQRLRHDLRQSYKNADVVITGKAAFDNANGNDGRAAADARVAPDRGAEAARTSPLAAGSVTTDSLKLIGKDGKVIATGGAPSLGFSVTPAGQPFNPTKLTAGKLAAAATTRS